MNSLIAVIPYIQIALSILLVAGILLQRPDTVLGGAFGSSDIGGSINFERRGFEKFIFNATIVIAFLFVLSALFVFIA